MIIENICSIAILKRFHSLLQQAKENWQLLGGEGVPSEVLRSLLVDKNGSPLPCRSVLVIHLTPYDGCAEQAALHLKDDSDLTVRVLSVGLDAGQTNTCLQKLRSLFLEDWRSQTCKTYEGQYGNERAGRWQ